MPIAPQKQNFYRLAQTLPEIQRQRALLVIAEGQFGGTIAREGATARIFMNQSSNQIFHTAHLAFAVLPGRTISTQSARTGRIFFSSPSATIATTLMG